MLLSHISVLLGTATAMILVLIIYASNFYIDENYVDYSLYYSFYMTCVAPLPLIVGAIFACVDMMRSDNYEITHERLK